MNFGIGYRWLGFRVYGIRRDGVGYGEDVGFDGGGIRSCWGFGK